MATVFYRLIKSKELADGRQPIYLVCKQNEGGRSQNFTHFTGEHARPDNWIKDKKKGYSRVKATTPRATEINALLRKYRNDIESIISNAKIQQIEPTIEYIQNKFYTDVIKKTDTKKLSLFEHLQKFIENPVNKEGNILTDNTAKVYKTLLRSLLAFQKETSYKVTFESINHNFYSKYSAWLFNTEKLLTSSKAKRIGTLKAFLTVMTQRKHNTNKDYLEFNSTRPETATKIVLTENELLDLFSLDLSEHPTLAKVRDVFCFGCFTGLRFSDIEHLRPEHIQQVTDKEGNPKTAAKFTIQKTKKIHTVPLNNYALTLLEIYNGKLEGGKLLPTISNQKTNFYLKELGKLAELNTLVQVVNYSGGKRIDKTLPKYELMTTHTARRTFATLSLQRGMTPAGLQKILGHHDLKQVMQYVKYSEQVTIQEMADTWNLDVPKRKRVVPLKIAN